MKRINSRQVAVVAVASNFLAGPIAAGDFELIDVERGLLSLVNFGDDTSFYAQDEDETDATPVKHLNGEFEVPIGSASWDLRHRSTVSARQIVACGTSNVSLEASAGEAAGAFIFSDLSCTFHVDEPTRVRLRGRFAYYGWEPLDSTGNYHVSIGTNIHWVEGSGLVLQVEGAQGVVQFDEEAELQPGTYNFSTGVYVQARDFLSPDSADSYCDYSLVLSTSSCASDLDADGTVDSDDLAALLRGFGTPTVCYEDGDINFNRVVDLADLARLLNEFGAACD